ncbi:MAG: efflux RND transporter periplasmic adaptor subunit [Solirubrobacterales bacterium]
MKTDMKDKMQKLMAQKQIKVIAAVVLILVVIIAGVSVSGIFTSNKGITQKTAVVKKGNLSATVKGSGIVSSTNESKMNAEVSGKVAKVNYKEGDTVKAGDVILEFDDKDAKTSMAGSVNGLEQSQKSAQSSYNNYNDLTVKAPFSGRVTKVIVNKGDELAAGSQVATVSDPSKLKVLLSYNAKDAANIAVGQQAQVYLTSLMESINGTVTYVSNDSATTNSGGLVNSVEIQMDNPGAVAEGTSASADIAAASGNVSSTNTAAISYVNKKTVISTTGGTVDSVLIKENQKVSTGEAMVIIKNDNVKIAKDVADLKIAASQTTLTNSVNLASKYKVVAPFDGIIKKIGYDVGDSVNTGTEVVVVDTPNALQVDIPVDELDIASIAIGQKVNLTLDALPETTDTPMLGEVIKISPNATTLNGVTTYPVTVKFDGDISKLKVGMNVSAEIQVNTMTNVIYIPKEAVINSGNKSYVWVKDTEKSKDAATDGYYADAVKKEVKKGTGTNRYTSIESGLKEGDIVVLPLTKASSNPGNN